MATAFPHYQHRRSTSPGAPGTPGGTPGATAPGGTRVRRTRGERNRRSGQRETLMKDLDRERMLRADAEQRLKDMTLESDTTKQRLVGLQNEFKKMEEMVRSMVSYKHKIDALKQEKSNLITSYEASVAKYQTHVKNLDRENRMLLSEIKKLESQTPAVRSSEEAESKTKVLLERLKMLEAENSALVLENETQRQQYEKCLDSIANQVVQALLTQKGLREECGKLQKRVVDLEHQNRHLNHMFQQRIRFASDSVLQSALSKVGMGKVVGGGSTSGECHSPGSSGGSYSSLNLQQQLAALNEMTGEGGSLLRPGEEQAASACSFDSIFSLHSICSDYNDHSQCEDGLGRPEMSSPPPWLRDKISFPFSDAISSDASDQGQATKTLPVDVPRNGDQTIPKTVIESTYEMETEFPATNSSPKMKHILHERRVTSPGASTPEAVSALHACVKSLTDTASKVCGDTSTVQKEEVCSSNDKKTDSTFAQKDSALLKVPMSPAKEAAKKSAVKLVRCKSCEQRPAAEAAPCMACASENSLSPGQELLKLADSFNEKFVVNGKDGLPCIQNKILDTSSDEEASSRPVSHTYSAASTVSLNELLERELDEMETPNDDGFSFDNLPIYTNEQLQQLGIPDSPTKTGQATATNQDQEHMEDPVRDTDPDRSESKLSKSSSQSESSILSQRPLKVTDSTEMVLNNGRLSSECSPSLKRPTSLALSQEQLIDSSDGEGETSSHQSTPTNDCVKNTKRLSSPSKSKSKSTQDFSPKHYLHNLGKSKSAKNLSCKEHHPLKLYNVLSPPGMHEEVLEKFKKVPPKVKPKPSIAMCLKINSKEDKEDGPLKPTSQRPEVDGRESSPREKKTIENDVKLKKVKNNLAETVGVQESLDSVDPMTSSSSSGSPDSAMQQSFSSSSSDNTLSDKPSCRDDGYLSNSTISMSSNDIPGEQLLNGQGQNFKRRPQVQSGVSSDVQQLRRRSQPQASSDVRLENTAINPNNRKSKTAEAYADKSKSLPAGLKLGPCELQDSTNSLDSLSSVENNPIGRVRDIKAFFEGKVEEKLRGRLSLQDKPEVAATGVRPRTVGRCMEQEARQISRSQSEDEKSSRKLQQHTLSIESHHTQSWHSEDGILGKKVPNSLWVPRQKEPSWCVDKGMMNRGRKPRRPRLRRSWSDTTINRCMSDIHREENKCLHAALRRDWARFCGVLTGQARASSLPLNKDIVPRKRSVSPRLLPRRLQHSNLSQESVRLTGEGAECRMPPLGRPEAVGCASHQMAASYPSESSSNRHWGHHRRVTSSDKNLLGWSSDSDVEGDSPPGLPVAGLREGPSPTLPEWRQGQERAEMLDTLVTAGFSSSGGEEDVYLPHGGATSPTSPTRPPDGALVDRLKDLPDGKQKVRVTTQFRQSVDRKTFVRYSDPEHHAIASFRFLEDMSSGQTSSQSEDELKSQKSKKQPTSTSKQKQAVHKQAARQQQQPSSSSKQHSSSSKQQPQKSQQAMRQAQAAKGSKAPTSVQSTRSVADGAAAGASENRKQGKVSVRNAESSKGRPANRTVLALKDESRKDNSRLSNASFEAAPLAGGDLSLSDSCCEDFSDTKA